MTKQLHIETVQAWARDRKPVLGAFGFLFAALAVLIVISVLRG